MNWPCSLLQCHLEATHSSTESRNITKRLGNTGIGNIVLTLV